jgi:RimJ/RimL family protein N-acetyltransferase
MLKAQSTEPMFYAIVTAAMGAVGGRLACMRAAPAHGVLEIGHVYFGPDIARRRVATEAMYLLLRFAFDGLAYCTAGGVEVRQCQ